MENSHRWYTFHADFWYIFKSGLTDALKRIKAVKLTSGKDEIIFRTEFPQKAHLAFKAVSLAPPPRILVYHKSQSVVSRQEEI